MAVCSPGARAAKRLRCTDCSLHDGSSQMQAPQARNGENFAGKRMCKLDQ
jgi:hypothetical protein